MASDEYASAGPKRLPGCGAPGCAPYAGPYGDSYCKVDCSCYCHAQQEREPWKERAAKSKFRAAAAKSKMTKSKWKKVMQSNRKGTAHRVAKGAKGLSTAQIAAGFGGKAAQTAVLGAQAAVRGAAVTITEPLPVYDERALCVKCGFGEVGTAYQSGVSMRKDQGGALLSHGYLLRTCTRCDYRWRERPLDVADPLEVLALEGRRRDDE